MRQDGKEARLDREDLKAAVRLNVNHFNDPATRDRYLASYAPDVRLHGFPPDVPSSRDGITGFYQAIWGAFPDFALTIEDVLAEGDTAVVRFAWVGTHRGAFMGVPPTGRVVRGYGITLMRYQDGLIAERWQAMDLLGVMLQLGLELAPAKAAGPA